MTSESEAHLKIKGIIYQKLKEWYGASIPEYYDSSHELDVYSVTSDGISIYVEVIWSPSKQNLNRDLLIIQRAVADIILVVANPEIIKNEKLTREYEKTLISKRKARSKMEPMINGQTVLDNSDYIEHEFRHVVDVALAEKRMEGKEKEPDLEVYFLNEEGKETEEIVVRPQYVNEIIQKIKGRDPHLTFKGFLEAEATLRSIAGKTPTSDLVLIKIKLVNSGTIGAEHIHIFLKFPENCILHDIDEFRGLYSLPYVKRVYSGLYPDDLTAKAGLDRLGNNLEFDRFDPIYVHFPPEESEVEILATIIQEGYQPKDKKLKIIVVPSIKNVKKEVYEDE
jgi:hypothetical protein